MYNIQDDVPTKRKEQRRIYSEIVQCMRVTVPWKHLVDKIQDEERDNTIYTCDRIRYHSKRESKLLSARAHHACFLVLERTSQLCLFQRAWLSLLRLLLLFDLSYK